MSDAAHLLLFLLLLLLLDPEGSADFELKTENKATEKR